MNKTPLEMAKFFKALGDENRVKIVLLIQSRTETCSCGILRGLDIEQPTLSHHMKILCDAGVITPTRNGKFVHYTISPDAEELLNVFFSSVQ